MSEDEWFITDVFPSSDNNRSLKSNSVEHYSTYTLVYGHHNGFKCAFCKISRDRRIGRHDFKMTCHMNSSAVPLKLYVKTQRTSGYIRTKNHPVNSFITSIIKSARFVMADLSTNDRCGIII